jgi:ubiquinone/menaquinone biosynthesis C-methylase UbiE
MNIKYAKKLLNKTVNDYNRMAPYFSITRPHLSADLLELKQYTQKGDRVLDLGCGNGRLYDLFKEIGSDYTGIDVSAKMIEIARAKFPDGNFKLQKNPSEIKFQNHTFDEVYCLSVFHHIPSLELRLKLLKEIKRVLKPGGNLVMTVWNLQNRPKLFLELLYNKIRNPFLDFGDLFIPFHDNTGKLIANRYHHSYSGKELVNLAKSLGFKVLETRHQKRGKKRENENILVIAKS